MDYSQLRIDVSEDAHSPRRSHLPELLGDTKTNRAARFSLLPIYCDPQTQDDGECV